MPATNSMFLIHPHNCMFYRKICPHTNIAYIKHLICYTIILSLHRIDVYERIGESDYAEIDSQQADSVELQQNAAYCSQVQLQQNVSYITSTENDNKEPVYVNNHNNMHV